jgi:transposase
VQKRTRRKTNAIDARELAGRLFNYLNGNQQALQLVRIPSIEQERRRLKSRQHDQLVKERKRLAAQGNSILLSQGWGGIKNWWRPRIFERLSQVVVPEIKELLEVWLELLHKLDEKIQQAKAQQKRSQKGPRPKGLGAGSLEQLESELLD